MALERAKQDSLKRKRTEMIFEAVRASDMEVLKDIFESGALDVDAFQDENGDTPLNVAAACGRDLVVDYLLDKGAQPNIANKDGKTALAHAFEDGNKRCIENLLKSGADVSILYENGFEDIVKNNVLDLARNGETPLLMKVLDQVDVNDIKDGHGDSLLNEAARFGHAGTVRALLECGAAVDEPNQEGRTALYWAMRDQYNDCINLLISAGAKARFVHDTASFKQLNDRLVKYAQKGETKALFEESTGFDLDTFVDNVGDSLLNEAARCDQLQTVKALVEAGVTIDRPGKEHGRTALEWAVNNGYEDVAFYLAEQGAETDRLEKILKNDCGDKTRNLIQQLQNPYVITSKRPLGEVQMVEVYDFKTQERISYVEGEKGYSAPVREFFYEIRDRSSLHQAFNRYAKRVPDAQESVLYGPDAVPTLRKNKLPLKKHL